MLSVTTYEATTPSGNVLRASIDIGDYAKQSSTVIPADCTLVPCFMNAPVLEVMLQLAGIGFQDWEGVDLTAVARGLR